MAYAGGSCSWSRPSAPSSTGREKLERARWFLLDRGRLDRLPVPRRAAGWVLTEIGRQPWIVQGLLRPRRRNSPSVSTAWLAISLAVFITLYVVLGVVDFVLMRRYARPRPARPAPRRAARSRR